MPFPSGPSASDSEPPRQDHLLSPCSHDKSRRFWRISLSLWLRHSCSPPLPGQSTGMLKSLLRRQSCSAFLASFTCYVPILMCSLCREHSGGLLDCSGTMEVTTHLIRSSTELAVQRAPE